jgi:hypothetical protein
MMSQEAAQVYCLSCKAMAGEQAFHAGQAQQIPMIFLARSDDMLRNLVHLEKAQAHALTSDAANFPDGLLKTGRREVFEQVMHDAKIEGLGIGLDFENVALPETHVWKKSAGIINIFLAKIKSRVAKEARHSVPVKKSIIVG